MKRNFITLVAAAAAAALLLTGCGEKKKPFYGANYSETHSEYLKYSLGSDYTLELVEPDVNETHRSTWKFSYKDDDDKTRECTLTTYDYADAQQSGSTLSEQQFYDCELLNCLYPEAADAARRGLSKDILSKYFELGDYERSTSAEPKKGVSLQCSCPVALSSTPECYPLVQAALQPKTGLKVRAATMSNMAKDKNVLLSVSLEITDDAVDAAEYVDAMRHVYESFWEKTTGPQNYRFAVTRIPQDGGEYETLYEKAALLGSEEFDTAERYGTSKNAVDSMLSELRGMLTK